MQWNLDTMKMNVERMKYTPSLSKHYWQVKVGNTENNQYSLTFIFIAMQTKIYFAVDCDLTSKIWTRNWF